MMSRQRIVIIGGGFGGVFTAKNLRRCMQDAEIELINDTNYFVFQPLLPEVASGMVNAQDAAAPMRALLHKMKFRMAEVQSVDMEKREVRVLQGLKTRFINVPYDHLVIACGLRPNLSLLPGFAEHGLPMKNIADAFALRNHVIQCLEHADVTSNQELKSQLLTFVVAGGGLSGVETAGELYDMLRRTLKYYPSIQLEEIKLALVHRGDRLLPELSKTMGERAYHYLTRRGVDVLLNTTMRGATSTSVAIEDGDKIRTRTLVATIGMEPTPLVASLPLKRERGRIITNRFLQADGFDNIWALGDAAYIPLDDAGEQYAPPTAQFTVREAKQLSANIAAALNGKPLQPFRYKAVGTLASLGNRRGVGEIFGISLSGFSAWFLWRSFYLSIMPGFTTQLRVAFNWLLDLFMPINIVQIGQRPVRACRFLRFGRGETISEPGQVTQGLYSVVSGALESHVQNPDTGDEYVRVLGAGTHWGERTASGNMTTVGTLKAIKDTRVLVLHKDDFIHLRQSFYALNEYFEGLPESLYPDQLQRHPKFNDEEEQENTE